MLWIEDHLFINNVEKFEKTLKKSREMMSISFYILGFTEHLKNSSTINQTIKVVLLTFGYLIKIH